MWQSTWLGSYDLEFRQGVKNIDTVDRNFADWLSFYSRHYIIKIQHH